MNEVIGGGDRNLFSFEKPTIFFKKGIENFLSLKSLNNNLSQSLKNSYDNNTVCGPKNDMS